MRQGNAIKEEQDIIRMQKFLNIKKGHHILITNAQAEKEKFDKLYSGAVVQAN